MAVTGCYVSFNSEQCMEKLESAHSTYLIIISNKLNQNSELKKIDSYDLNLGSILKIYDP